MANCPKCGSPKFRYELRSAGTKSSSSYYRTGVKNSWFLPAGEKTRKSERMQKAVGICPDCGYVEDKQQDQQIGLGCLALIVLIVLFVVVINAPSKSSSSKETTPQNNSIWSVEFASLSDFDYYIDDNAIFLKDYNGQSSKVRIAPSYKVDGIIMDVVELDGTFVCKRVESVIVPENVTQIGHNTFNSCGVKNLFLPASLKDFDGWYYFHDVEKIYYGGTQDQWDELYTNERSQLDVVQIIPDSNIDDLLTDAALDSTSSD